MFNSSTCTRTQWLSSYRSKHYYSARLSSYVWLRGGEEREENQGEEKERKMRTLLHFLSHFRTVGGCRRQTWSLKCCGMIYWVQVSSEIDLGVPMVVLVFIYQSLLFTCLFIFDSLYLLTFIFLFICLDSEEVPSFC